MLEKKKKGRSSLRGYEEATTEWIIVFGCDMDPLLLVHELGLECRRCCCCCKWGKKAFHTVVGPLFLLKSILSVARPNRVHFHSVSFWLKQGSCREDKWETQQADHLEVLVMVLECLFGPDLIFWLLLCRREPSQYSWFCS